MRDRALSGRRFAAVIPVLLGAILSAGAVEVRKIRPSQPDDESLRKEVLARLSGWPGVESRSVEVEIRDGALVLAGEVPSLFDRSEAERLSSAVSGLASITNRIGVRRSEIPDSLLQLNAMRALEASPRLRAFGLEVAVAGAELTITGEVPLARDRIEAEKLASRVEGITALHNQIQLAYTRVDPAIIQKRLTGLLGNKLVFGGVEELGVEVDDQGVVTLRGITAAHVDRLRAERLAYGIPGVTRVVNLMTVRLASPSGS